MANGGFEGKQGKRVARAIISLGQREISRLRRIRNDRPLNDSELVQLERLSDVMSPITKQIPDRAFALNFMQDPSVAQDMFNLIGQERISQLTAEGTREILLSRVAHLRKSSDRPVTLLDDETIRSAISFSDEQATRLDEICENARDEYRKGSVEAYEEIEHLLVNHWEQLIGLLDSSQAKTARSVIGQPTPWFKAESDLIFLGGKVSGGSFMIVNGDPKSNKSPDGRFLHKLTAEELTNLDKEFIFIHAYLMLESKFVREELELQSEQLKALSEKIHMVTVIPVVPESRLKKLFEGGVEQPPWVEGVLLAHHLELFRQMEVQVLTSEYQSSNGLSHPDVAKALELSFEQQKDIRRLSRSFEKEAKVLVEQIKAGRQEVRRRVAIQAEELLTTVQRQKLRALIGEFAGAHE